jgi:hypothetical protein
MKVRLTPRALADAKRARNHLYYVVTATEIVVLTVWGAPKGQGPKLSPV